MKIEIKEFKLNNQKRWESLTNTKYFNKTVLKFDDSYSNG